MKLRNASVVLALVCGVFIVTGRGLRAESAADLFNAQSLQRIDLDLHSADWAKLKTDFQSNEYYPADVTWNGLKVRNTGIRSRGAASRSGSKPGLRVDFNRYDTTQTFLGLRSFVLDNLAQDASGVHETVAMWFFGRLGIPAPREAHATLYVNGEYAGLYAVVESIDKEMLSRVFGNGEGSQNDGYLYEYNKAAVWGLSYLGADLDRYKAFFSAKTHETNSDETLYRPLETLIRLINESTPADLVAKVGPLLDLDEVVRYVALQNFISEIDGFVGQFGTNNFYLYRLQHHDKHEVIAWDEDLSFLDPRYALTELHGTNVLMVKLMAVREYRDLYFATLREAADAAEAGATVERPGALETEIRRELALTLEALERDPQRLSTETEFLVARDQMKQFAPQRIRYVQCEVARLAGEPLCD